MKNLENYDVLELNAKEIIMTDGGILSTFNPSSSLVGLKIIGNEISDFISGFKFTWNL